MHEKYSNEEIVKLSNYILKLEKKLEKFDSLEQQLLKVKMNYASLEKNFKDSESLQKIQIDSLNTLIANKKNSIANEDKYSNLQLTDEDKLVEKQMIEFLKKIKFDLGSYAIKKDLYFKLELVADLLKKFKTAEYEIVGYADTTGSTSYNFNLSKMRALTVKAYLVSKGIESARLKIIAKGEEISIQSNSALNDMSESRRVEIRNIKNKTNPITIK
jgi:outer membrane protein OmpA-like peptidoglycan-associated protein